MTDTASNEAPNIPVGWYQESQFTQPRPEVPRPDWWHTFDIQGTEAEVIELMGGFVRALQPEVVLETGTSRGYMARQLAHSLKCNGHGHLWTYEPVLITAAEAGATCADWAEWLTIMVEPSMSEWNNGPIDVAWFDSQLHLRWAEFDFYYPHMHAGTVVGFHDTAPHFGEWSEQIRDDQRLQWFELPTPRGAIIGRIV